MLKPNSWHIPSSHLNLHTFSTLISAHSLIQFAHFYSELLEKYVLISPNKNNVSKQNKTKQKDKISLTLQGITNIKRLQIIDNDNISNNNVTHRILQVR